MNAGERFNMQCLNYANDHNDGCKLFTSEKIAEPILLLSGGVFCIADIALISIYMWLKFKEEGLLESISSILSYISESSGSKALNQIDNIILFLNDDNTFHNTAIVINSKFGLVKTTICYDDITALNVTPIIDYMKTQGVAQLDIMELEGHIQQRNAYIAISIVLATVLAALLVTAGTYMLAGTNNQNQMAF